MARAPLSRYAYGIPMEWHGMPLFRQAGLSLVHASHQLGPHRNPGFEVTYITAGEVAWQVFDAPVPVADDMPDARLEPSAGHGVAAEMHLTGGDLALMQSRVLHQGEYQIIAPCRLLWYVVDPDVADACRHTCFTESDMERIAGVLRRAGNVVVRADPWMLRLFQSVEETLRAFDSGADRAVLVPWLRTLMCQLLLRTTGSLEQHATAMESAPIRLAREYMEAHLAEPLSVADMAAAAGLGVSRFHEVFRDEVGQTPADYFSRLRIQCARERLVSGDDPVTRIAMDLGFSTSQYFANTFRKYTGMSPSAYRRQHRAF